MLKVSRCIVVILALGLAGCETVEGAWDATVDAVGSVSMPDVFSFEETPDISACQNPLCDGLPEKDCQEIPYCQKP